MLLTFKINIYSPTTCNSPDTICVWNDGASALTSHENFPLICGTTLFNTILLAFDDSTCVYFQCQACIQQQEIKRDRKIGLVSFVDRPQIFFSFFIEFLVFESHVWIEFVIFFFPSFLLRGKERYFILGMVFFTLLCTCGYFMIQ